jgi:hypothetical protein
LLEAISRGEFVINGFRNRDLQLILYTTSARSVEESRRRSAVISRKLRLLRHYSLIQKIQDSYRYKVTHAGEVRLLHRQVKCAVDDRTDASA